MRVVAYVILALLFGGITSYALLQGREERNLVDLLKSLREVKEELSQTKNDLLGYTKYTDYISVSKSAIEGQMKFLAAKIDREYFHVEHIERSTIGIKSYATIIIKYKVEYSFGFDLNPGSFSISSDSGKDGIIVTLRKPELVASPSVDIISHETPGAAFLIDEKAAVIDLQQKLLGIAKTRAKEIKNDAEVIALCEKKLAEFLRDFLAKQPGVRVAPVIKFAYMK